MDAVMGLPVTQVGIDIVIKLRDTEGHIRNCDAADDIREVASHRVEHPLHAACGVQEKEHISMKDLGRERDSQGRLGSRL